MADVQSCEEDAITASLSLALKCVGIVWHCWISMATSHKCSANVTMETKGCTLLQNKDDIKAVM
jgi:hypothetical protein